MFVLSKQLTLRTASRALSSQDIFNEDLSSLLSPDENTSETTGLRLKLPYSAANEPYSIISPSEPLPT